MLFKFMRDCLFGLQKSFYKDKMKLHLCTGYVMTTLELMMSNDSWTLAIIMP